MAPDVQKEPQRPSRIDPMVVAVNALGITQITAWGTSYYCLGVLAKPIVAETGWPMTTVFLGFSVALLIMGLISTTVGGLIDRFGARAVMAVGTIIVTAGLVALAQVNEPTSYLAVWAIIGVGMRCCLYDAAFAALVQVTPTRGRTAISYVTLYGAYASTVFWVIGHYLNEAFGWRGTLIIFAAINLVVCLPLNWIGLAHRESPERTADAAELRQLPRMVRSSKGASVWSASFSLPLSCRSTDLSSVSSRCSWCLCLRLQGSPVPLQSGWLRSRGTASLLADWSRYFPVGV